MHSAKICDRNKSHTSGPCPKACAVHMGVLKLPHTRGGLSQQGRGLGGFFTRIDPAGQKAPVTLGPAGGSGAIKAWLGKETQTVWSIIDMAVVG